MFYAQQGPQTMRMQPEFMYYPWLSPWTIPLLCKMTQIYVVTFEMQIDSKYNMN
jgi:hypothetical protein